MPENRIQSPLTQVGRALSRARRTAPEAPLSERLRSVDQAIAAINARHGLSEAQRARGIAALEKARLRIAAQVHSGRGG